MRELEDVNKQEISSDGEVGMATDQYCSWANAGEGQFLTNWTSDSMSLNQSCRTCLCRDLQVSPKFSLEIQKPEGGKAKSWKRTELEGTVLIWGHNLSSRVQDCMFRCEHRCWWTKIKSRNRPHARNRLVLRKGPRPLHGERKAHHQRCWAECGVTSCTPRGSTQVSGCGFYM